MRFKLSVRPITVILGSGRVTEKALSSRDDDIQENYKVNHHVMKISQKGICDTT
jgi:hypothetical protein